MKKFSALVACGLGTITFAAATSAHAAVPSTTHGNLRHSQALYWCDKGTPNFVIGVEAVKTAEKVNVSSKAGFTSMTLGPVSTTQGGYVFALKNLAGRSFSLNFTGLVTKSAFTVPVSIPATCGNLPSTMPLGPKGSTTPTKPTTPTTPTTPTKPTKPSMPTMPSKPSMPTKPAMPAPAKPAAPAQGPVVQTDYVAPADHSAELAVGAFGLVAAGAGSLVVARRGSRR